MSCPAPACTCRPEWPELTEVMAMVAVTVREFYKIPGCTVGGPLHIITDDDNVEDTHLSYCWGALYDEPIMPEPGPFAHVDPYERYRVWWRRDQTAEETEWMVRLGGAILWGLGSMSIDERLCVTGQTYSGGRGPFPPPWPPAGYLSPLQEDYMDDALYRRASLPVPEWVCDECRSMYDLPARTS